ncbi:amidohydrolase [bacterium]|nr:amidohydrolase [bacterium]
METPLNEQQLNQLQQLRRHLHQHPELSLQEAKTQQWVKEFLQKHAAPHQLKEVGNTGLAAIYGGHEKGERILLRCDLDALPIAEVNEFEHKSVNQGVGHKCGHDGHATILCGVAMHLAKNPPAKGQVVLLFQPAEEIGEGAKAVLADKQFDQIKPDRVFALHNIPGYPMHSVVYRYGAFTASVVSLVLKITGKTAHAAEPENGINPSYFMAELLSESKKLMHTDLESDDFALCTPTHGMFGDDFAYGTAAGYGELRLTIRTWTNEKMNLLMKQLLEKVAMLTEKHKVRVQHEWTQEFRANQNDAACVETILASAKNCGSNCIKRETPFKWGEDFGLFTEKFPGAMFGLGSGENCPALHNPDYDFPDELIATGVALFSQIITQQLG